MANYTRRKQIPQNSGGSYTPKGVTRPPRHVLKEKIGEMMRYAMPLVTAFPARDRSIGDCLKMSMLNLLRLTIELDRAEDKHDVVKRLSIEFATLKELIVLASDRDFYDRKYAPPLSMKRREVWGRYNLEIATMIESLEKA